MHAYGTDQSRLPGYAAIAVVAVILSIVTGWLVDTTGWQASWLVSAPAVATSFGIVFRLYDRWAWRQRPAGIDLGNMPNVEGTYEGQLVSTYKDTTLPIRVCIDQTWTQVAVRFDVLGTTTSTSLSMTALLRRTGHAETRLLYTYRNEIRPGVAAPDMRDHDGTAELTFDLRTGEVSGRYYNARGRQGTMSLRRV